MFTKKQNRDVWILLLVFVISRIILWLIGIRFYADPINYYVQYIDPVHLKERLFQSLFFLHSQPPLFNLFLGVVLKTFPGYYIQIFTAIYQFLGFIIMISSFLIMTRLGVNNLVGLILVTCFIVSPSVILYENWLFYSYPIAALLCLATLFLHQYLKTKSVHTGVIFFVLLMLLVCTRSTFHLLWYLFWVIVISVPKVTNWKKSTAIALLPFLMLLGIYIKNFVISGTFTSSSTWVGYQTAKMTLGSMSSGQLRNLTEKAKISELTVKTIESAHWIGYSLHTNNSKTGVPILDENFKPSARKYPNFNSLVALLNSKIMLKDGLFALKNFPGQYLKSLSKSFLLYFFPGPTDENLINRGLIKNYENSYNFAFSHLNKINSYKLYEYHLFDVANFPSLKWDTVSITMLTLVIVFYLILIAYGCRTVLWLTTQKTIDVPQIITLVFIVGNIIYISIVSNVFGYWANNRYRFPIDSFYLIILGLIICNSLKKFNQQKNSLTQ